MKASGLMFLVTMFAMSFLFLVYFDTTHPKLFQAPEAPKIYVVDQNTYKNKVVDENFDRDLPQVQPKVITEKPIEQVQTVPGN